MCTPPHYARCEEVDWRSEHPQQTMTAFLEHQVSSAACMVPRAGGRQKKVPPGSQLRARCSAAPTFAPVSQAILPHVHEARWWRHGRRSSGGLPCSFLPCAALFVPNCTYHTYPPLPTCLAKACALPGWPRLPRMFRPRLTPSTSPLWALQAPT